MTELYNIKEISKICYDIVSSDISWLEIIYGDFKVIDKEYPNKTNKDLIGYYQDRFNEDDITYHNMHSSGYGDMWELDGISDKVSEKIAKNYIKSNNIKEFINNCRC